MPSPDLDGSAPDKSAVALILIDVINDLDFPEGDQLLQDALPMAKQLALLKRRAKAQKIPVIYANDNFGRWRSDFQAQVTHCLDASCKGRPLTNLLKPDEQDYFILKPKHSGFYSTTLELLLQYLQTKTLILTGIAANRCVYFTASDAYMRDYALFVPSDCVVSNTRKETEEALAQMQKLLKADIRPASEIDLGSFQQDGH